MPWPPPLLALMKTMLSTTPTLSATSAWQDIEHCFIPTATTPIVRMDIGPSSTDNTAMYLDDMALEIL
jgi:hypothetical protein